MLRDTSTNTSTSTAARTPSYLVLNDRYRSTGFSAERRHVYTALVRLHTTLLDATRWTRRLPVSSPFASKTSQWTIAASTRASTTPGLVQKRRRPILLSPVRMMSTKQKQLDNKFAVMGLITFDILEKKDKMPVSPTASQLTLFCAPPSPFRRYSN